LDIEGLLQDILDAPEGSIFLLHACAHNPTGCDPTMEQWNKIADALEKKNHLAFFDSAYQGFASGNAEKDAAAVRMFVARNTIPVLLAQSFAKNFGLYGERCGTFSVVCQTPKEAAAVKSRLQGIIRPMYSNPPKHGSTIVKTVLNDPVLSKQYYGECKKMASRIGDMRQQLVEALAKVGSKHDWSHITQQIGMFAFTGMSPEMVDTITEKYHVYMTRDGRISMAGLYPSNLEYVANAIHQVTEGKSITA
jgi:aspartate aminotransferase